MEVQPTTPQAYKLLHEGSLTLSKIEHNGFRIDVDYLEKTILETDQKIKEQEKLLRSDSVYEQWRRWKGSETSLGSREQLGHVLYNILGYPVTQWCEKSKKPKVDETALSAIDLPFAKNYLRLEKLKKIRTTYLGGIQREVVDGYLRPSFNLHTTQTYRSSAQAPNSQNIPTRNKELSSIVRRAFISRKGRQLVEIDYSGIEVRIAACYNQDPALIHYIQDPSTDMHRDMAMECFLLKKKQVSKQTRYVAKNMFVFPEFYGSYYLQCAENMWEAIGKMDLKIENGSSLYEHLKEKGIKERGKCNPEDRPRSGTFEYHIQEVERKFWGEKFPTYAKWKKAWWEAYLEEGAFNTHTGFRISGILKRNDVSNYPVQGAAFHCLLWSIIEIQKEIERRNLKTFLVGQIHDCLIADVPTEELAEFVSLCKEIMTQRLLSAWKWIIVPLDVEVEICPVGGSWFDKEVVKM